MLARAMTILLTILAATNLAGQALAQSNEGASAGYTMRISADEPFKSDLKACLDASLAKHPELRESNKDFNYFVTLIGMPIIQDSDGEVLGYSVTSLVLSPMLAQAPPVPVSAEAWDALQPYLTRAHNLLGYKLFIMRKQTLDETCLRVAESIAAAIAVEEARQSSMSGVEKK